MKIQRFDNLNDFFHETQLVILKPFDVLEVEFPMKDLLIGGNCLESPANTTNFNYCFVTLW